LDHIALAADPITALGEAPAPPRAGDAWKGFVEMAPSLRAGRSGWPAAMEQARLWYEPHVERVHEDAVLLRVDLVQLEQIAAGYRKRLATRQECRC
jgi:DNA helicase II / ATP-dependent DNA helicase PcrA